MVSKKGKIISARIAFIFIWVALILAASALLKYMGNNRSYIDSLNNNSFFPNISDFAIILFILFIFALGIIGSILRFSLSIKLLEEIRANPPSKSLKNRMIGLFLIFVCIVIFYLLIKIKNGTI